MHIYYTYKYVISKGFVLEWDFNKFINGIFMGFILSRIYFP